MKDVHPIELERGFISKTVPLSEFVEELLQCIADLMTSLVVTGVQRNGKTTAMEFIKAQMASNRSCAFFNAMALTVDPRKRAGRDLEAAFWRTFLIRTVEDARINFESNYKAFLTAIKVACDRLDTRHVVICIDDAQKLTPPMFGYLKQLHEQLLPEGYQPFFLLIAQPDMPLRMHQLQVDSMHEYIDRFLTNDFRFRGNRRQDLPVFLRHYDTATWPAGSGVSYTQHFAPGLWRAGWRLEDEAGPMWSAFETLAKRLGLNTGELEIGTKFLVSACKASLLALQGGNVERLDHVTWQAAAERSGYYKTRLVVGDPEAAAQEALKEVVWREQTAKNKASKGRAKGA
jgi:type II secretory pathway predicted ATPase ExeA